MSKKKKKGHNVIECNHLKLNAIILLKQSTVTTVTKSFPYFLGTRMQHYTIYSPQHNSTCKTVVEQQNRKKKHENGNNSAEPNTTTIPNQYKLNTIPKMLKQANKQGEF